MINNKFNINLNKEKTTLLLKGLSLLPVEDRKSIIYNGLQRELETVSVIWERCIKNEKILAEQRKSKLKNKIQAQK